MIYLDNQASTRVDPSVLEAMLPYFSEKYGNSASRTHKYGWDAEEAVEEAREKVAKLINADPNEIIFTSGATESNNTIIKNYLNEHIIISNIEHSSIYEPSLFFTRPLFAFINVSGTINLEFYNYLLIKNPKLISIMMVNNEIGTIQPIKEIKRESLNIPFHSDITQAIGKIKVNIKDLNIEYASFSSHKIYGPKGIGALYVKQGCEFSPLIYGGSHERGLRSGTLNVPAIVGFGKACEIIDLNNEHIKNCSNILINQLKLIPGINIHNFPNKIHHNLHFSVPCKDMDLFISKLSENVSVSFGSACMSLENKPSRVLKAVGFSDDETKRSIRISIGKFNTEKEMVLSVNFIKEAIDFSKGK